MSKLDELDKEFDEKFIEIDRAGRRRLKAYNDLARHADIKSFAHRYYSLGKLEEREAMKKVVEEKAQAMIFNLANADNMKDALGWAKYAASDDSRMKTYVAGQIYALSDLLNELNKS